MPLNLLTSIRFLKNLWTSPKKLTYDDCVYAVGSKIYLCDVRIVSLILDAAFISPDILVVYI